jgi:hypothetical protein
MDKAIIAAAAFAAVAVSSGSASAQGKKFDGRWSIEVLTDKGECDRAYRYAVIVENGRARYGGPEGFNVTGGVQPSGAVSGSIIYGSNRADVRGRLSGGWGQGNWTFVGARRCSGHWNAEKRG